MSAAVDRLAPGRLLARVLGAYALVTAVATVAYALLVPLVLGAGGAAIRSDAVLYGLLAGGAAFALLAGAASGTRPALARAAEAVAEGDTALPGDRDAIYALPRRAAGLVALLAFGVLVVGYVPVGDGGAADQARAIATTAGAVCAVLVALVLYAVTRVALRPLVETLRDDDDDDDDAPGRLPGDPDAAPPAADRVVSRVAAAIAVPAGAAALMAILLVSAHRAKVYDEEAAAAQEAFAQALSVRLEPRGGGGAGAGSDGDEDARIEVAASALRGAGVAVEERDGRWVVASREASLPRPVWALPIALLVALAAAQVGRRIGQSASSDLESAARRLAVVKLEDIRSVTMAMVRPRSVPEIRDMALALDTLAATLLRMAADQKRALTVRTEAARVRSFVLASVSHDLRGPLNSVLGFAELLLSGVEGPLHPGQRESLEALGRGGKDLLRLVGDLLDHARLDAGRMALELARVSVDGVIERARAAAVERSKAPVARDAILIEGEAGLTVLADEERLGHAVGALVAFAMLRPGSDGRVVIRTRAEGDQVHVTIRGGGRALSREALARMFEPFDFAPSGARAPAGLNLAVSVARGIVALHRGAIEASPHDEGGVVLDVTLGGAGREASR